MIDHNVNWNTKQDLEACCKSHMAANGLEPNESLVPDGKIKRFAVNPKDKRRKEKPEWYIAWSGFSIRNTPYLTCVYGSWKSPDTKHQFNSWEQDQSNRVDEQELLALQQEMKRRKLEAEAAIKESHEKAALQAKEIWLSSDLKPLNVAFVDYAKVKGIDPVGAKFGHNPSGYPALIIPLQNIEGDIRSLQYISWDRKEWRSFKTFLTGGEKKGNFMVIGDLKDAKSLFVTEGYATGVSVHMATQETVVAACDAGNLYSVVCALRKKYQEAQITVAGDIGEVGIKAATKAAKAFSCRAVFPRFPEEKDKDQKGDAYADFNDLHQVCGLDETRKQLTEEDGQPDSEIMVETTSKELDVDVILQRKDPCAEFSLESFPEPLREYITEVSERTDAHLIMTTAACLGSIAGMVQKQLSISHFNTLHPNLWFLTIAESGGFKTTALNHGAEIVREKSKGVRQRIAHLKATRGMVSGKEKEILAAEILKMSLEDNLLPDKFSAEGFLEHLSQGHSGILLASEFGAVLSNMAKTHNGDLKMLLTDLYDVPQQYRYKTKTQGDLVLEEPCFSICGVSTLEWIRSNLVADDVSSGFFARFLLFAPPKKHTVPPALPSVIAYEESAAKKALLGIIKQAGDHDYSLAPSAKVEFEKFHGELYRMARSHTDRCQEILGPYLKRWSPYILKLAMIMRLVEDPLSNELSDTSIQAAWSMLLSAINSTVYLFEGELGESDHQRKCRIMLEWLAKQYKKTGKPATWGQIIRSNRLDGGSKDYEYVFKTLVESGRVSHTERLPVKDSFYVIQTQ